MHEQYDQNVVIYTVSELNREVKALLEEAYAMLWIEGEISNFSSPHSGHWYFSLKDATAQVRCAMFKGNQRGIGFTPKDGMHVMLRARVGLYENRGDFQLIAEHMEERGEGKLRRAYELLKQKLEAAGLFANTHKKPLPAFPQQIGIVTSATGAAVFDILTVLKRRHPSVPVIIYPTLVQGNMAPDTIVKAIETANKRQECDVLIVARGGGSLEDLWPFNDEKVAYAIYQSNIPIISAVGHEVDFSISDFVADIRAPTPSAAAEMVVPDSSALRNQLQRTTLQLIKCMQHILGQLNQRTSWLGKYLSQQHPQRQLLDKIQRLDYCELTLRQLMQQQLNTYQLKLSSVSATLHTLSPLATLQRGYAIAMTAEGNILRSAKEAAIHSKITVKLSEGALLCDVHDISS
ncbi:MAG TPA: exodeoxyribonuclease VII large subunit [Gammaproteobacteria bacterium]|jgi:exodeoxyribonuclease VII large subunit|nr:exodeoxyribonuclease VII large subunit [Gammaproteobacteria bacterium]